MKECALAETKSLNEYIKANNESMLKKVKRKNILP